VIFLVFWYKVHQSSLEILLAIVARIFHLVDNCFLQSVLPHFRMVNDVVGNDFLAFWLAKFATNLSLHSLNQLFNLDYVRLNCLLWLALVLVSELRLIKVRRALRHLRVSKGVEGVWICLVA
jgi:hypothetical protein